MIAQFVIIIKCVTNTLACNFMRSCLQNIPSFSSYTILFIIFLNFRNNCISDTRRSKFVRGTCIDYRGCIGFFDSTDPVTCYYLCSFFFFFLIFDHGNVSITVDDFAINATRYEKAYTIRALRVYTRGVWKLLVSRVQVYIFVVIMFFFFFSTITF